ncbi:TPA: hypothetical protein DDW69_03020 [candidate division CPR2 bacterium]|nr:MAG: hypothetical protein A2Y27_01930 [candidate division CPR2 bacterium GWD1_39_7]OGB70771.1 MAG: hypothetical protein A2Y26_02745 [candidate division CPR2 bacterium GWD2_39_7]HBG81789.1 hypothetical protein [candidate division CPR2 bacterium]HCM00039.1 hypothetical protein [candidate division CPR2 bacterium]
MLAKSLILSLLKWWYFESPKQFLTLAKMIARKIMDSLSISIILRTFFSPWKKVTSYKHNNSLEERVRALEDNAVSRLVGVVMRSAILILAALFIVFYIVTLMLGSIIWIIFPTLPIALAFYSLGFIIS